MLQESRSVAVLLAAYNGMQWIDEQLHSILTQEGVIVTIYISIDLSKDSTFEHIKELAKSCSSIELLPYGERFGGAAKNFFRLLRDVDIAKYDYIAFSDQDDIWNIDKLSNAVNSMEENRCEAYSSNVTAFWNNNKTLLINKAQAQTEFDYIFEAAGPGCTYVLTRNLADKLKVCMLSSWEELQQVYLHDWFIYAYARANNYKWFIDPNSSMQYRQHLNNQVGINSGRKAFWYRFKKLASGWGFDQALLICKIIGIENSAFVRSWHRLSIMELIKLSFNAGSCRRRMRDKFIFAIMCWVVALLRNKS